MAKAVQSTNSNGAEAKATKPAAAAKEKKAKTEVKESKASAATAKPKKPAEPVTPAKKVNKILITQPRPETDKSPYFDLARKYNLELDFHPFIRVEGVAGRDFRRQR